MGENVRRVLLIILDISGYTRFMLRHRMDQTHSQIVISELMGAIIERIELPLEISKLEGDAIFLYLDLTRLGEPWEQHRAQVARKIDEFFRLFLDRLAALQGANICKCGACTHIADLRLKAIIHAGEAVLHRLGRFEELHGIDVIVVHRLLKNSLPSQQYVLVTEAARGLLEFPREIAFRPHEETYDDVGAVRAFVHLRDDDLAAVPAIIRERRYDTTLRKIWSELRLIRGTLLFWARLKRRPRVKALEAA
jgi:hypothetical protein